MVGIPIRIGLFCAKEIAGEPKTAIPAVAAAPLSNLRRRAVFEFDVEPALIFFSLSVQMIVICVELTAIGRFYLVFVKKRSLRKTLGVLSFRLRLYVTRCAKVSGE